VLKSTEEKCFPTTNYCSAKCLGEIAIIGVVVVVAVLAVLCVCLKAQKKFFVLLLAACAFTFQESQERKKER